MDRIDETTDQFDARVTGYCLTVIAAIVVLCAIGDLIK
jgi:hypothetical protein